MLRQILHHNSNLATTKVSTLNGYQQREGSGQIVISEHQRVSSNHCMLVDAYTRIIGVINHPVRLLRWNFGVLERIPRPKVMPNATLSFYLFSSPIKSQIPLCWQESKAIQDLKQRPYTIQHHVHISRGLARTGGRSEPGRSSAAGTVAEPACYSGERFPIDVWRSW